MNVKMIVSSKVIYHLPYYGREIDVQLAYGVYSNNNALAVLLLCRAADLDEDLLEDEDYYYDESLFDEVFGAITVNLESSGSLLHGEQFVDINNYPFIARWLEENMLAFPSGRKATCGFVQYPSYEFEIPPEFIDKLENGKNEVKS